MTGSCGSRSTRAGKPDGPRPRTPNHQDLDPVDSRGRAGFAPIATAGTQVASLGVIWLAIRIMAAVTANDVIRQSRGSTTIRDDQTLQFNMNGVHFPVQVLFQCVSRSS